MFVPRAGLHFRAVDEQDKSSSRLDDSIAVDAAEQRRLVEQLNAAMNGLSRLELAAAKLGMDADTYREYLRGEVARRRDGGAEAETPAPDVSVS